MCLPLAWDRHLEVGPGFSHTWAFATRGWHSLTVSHAEVRMAMRHSSTLMCWRGSPHAQAQASLADTSGSWLRQQL